MAEKIAEEGSRMKSRLSYFLILVSFTWLFFIIANSTPELDTLFIPDNYMYFYISITLIMISSFFNIIIFWLLIYPHINVKINVIIEVANLYCMSQIVKIIPGRIWGLIYQLSKSSERVPKTAIARVNIDLLILSIIGSLYFGVNIISYYYVAQFLIVFILSSVVFITIVSGGASSILLLIYKVTPPKYEAIIKNITSSKIPRTILAKVIPVYYLSWLTYLIAWYSLGHAYSNIDSHQMILLCGVYTISWVIGLLSAVTPSGIGVREVAFVFIGQGLLDPATLALLALIIRAILTTVDFLLAFLVLIISTYFNKSRP